MTNFLAIDKAHFGKGLKPIDLLILSQIEEFVRNGRDCYMTDEQFMYITGSGKSAVRDSLQRLEDKQFIIRHTRVVEGNGRANRERVISLKQKPKSGILKNNIPYPMVY